MRSGVDIFKKVYKNEIIGPFLNFFSWHDQLFGSIIPIHPGTAIPWSNSDYRVTQDFS